MTTNNIFYHISFSSS